MCLLDSQSIPYIKANFLKLEGFSEATLEKRNEEEQISSICVNVNSGESQTSNSSKSRPRRKNKDVVTSSLALSRFRADEICWVVEKESTNMRTNEQTEVEITYGGQLKV